MSNRKNLSWFGFLFSSIVLVLIGCATAPGAASKSAPAEEAVPGLQAAPQTLRSDEVTLIWEKPAGRRPGFMYEVLRDGTPVARTSKTHYTAAELEPETNHVFSVRTVADTEQPRVLVSQPLHLRTRPREVLVNVLDHGAVGDGVTLNTRALQAAIDACPVGGVVRIPEGVFLSGALFLKSDMTLEIVRGGVLQGSDRPSDYAPFIRNRFEGWELDSYASLLNAGTLDREGPANVRNISVRGQGKIVGGGKTLSDAVRAEFPGKKGLRSRGRLLLFMNAENVEVSGLMLDEPPSWTLHYIYSANVSLHGLSFRSRVYNGDGIDPDSSLNSYIFNNTFDTDDDCIAIKSGKNPEGNRINRPTVGVRIFDCRFVNGHGISIGSEISGGVRDVLIEDSVAGNLRHGLQIKATEERGGYVDNVVVRDCDLRQITVYTKLNYNNDGEAAPTPPRFRNFRFENIDLSKADLKKPVIHVNGFQTAGYETSEVSFENIRLPAGALVRCDRVRELTFKDVETTDGAPPRYEITASEGVRL